MTKDVAEVIKKYGEENGSEVQLDCQGAVWAVSFRDIWTTNPDYAMSKLYFYSKLKEIHLKSLAEEKRKQRLAA